MTSSGTSRNAVRASATVGAASGVVGLWWLTTELRAAAQRGTATLDETVGLAAAAACWLCVAWLVLAMVTSAAATLPGAAGRGASAIADLVTPWAWRNVLVAGLGLTVVNGPSAGAAEPMHLDSARGMGGVTQVERLLPAGLGADLPPLDRPADPAYVTVRPGDCLWSIARQRLGPQATDAEIAAAWPAWYEANRSVIGPDPNLLHPGQHLLAPG